MGELQRQNPKAKQGHKNDYSLENAYDIHIRLLQYETLQCKVKLESTRQIQHKYFYVCLCLLLPILHIGKELYTRATPFIHAFLSYRLVCVS